MVYIILLGEPEVSVNSLTALNKKIESENLKTN